MAHARQRQDGFASTGLVNLVIQALRVIDPEIFDAEISPPDPMKGATLDASLKRDLLNLVYETHGAGPLLCIGQHLNLAAEFPSLQVLMRSRSPKVLAEKWMRLERYYHSLNRTKIACEENALICKRYATDRYPSNAENLFIAGLILGLCGLAGAKNPILFIGAQRADGANLASLRFLPGEDLSNFRILSEDWPERSNVEHGNGLHDHAALLRQKLKALFNEDTARSWRISDVARILAKSSRSLQRELTANETSFSSVLRNSRVETANKLLLRNQVSLAEIGYCCGYADQAHFQRDFRRVMNMTPAEYRRLATA